MMESMILTKTLRFKVHRATRSKLNRLRWLWTNWGSTGYRMHDNMAKRYPTKHVLNQWGCLRLRQSPKSTVARWWLRLPVGGGELVNLPLRGAEGHENLLGSDVKVCNSEFIRRNGDFYIHITIQKEVSPPLMPYGRVLAVDLGERVVATSVAFDSTRWCEPHFHARSVRGVRRHYAWLRSRLQERGGFRSIASVGKSERRRVYNTLHEAAKAIVKQAESLDAVIAIGDLTGIRKRSRQKGRRLKSIVNAMPFRQLTSLVEYKAAWAGIPVLRVGEEYSSVECHTCNERGLRPSQGRFVCRSCGEYNADVNGAINIGKRALRYTREVGAYGFRPEGGPPFSRPSELAIAVSAEPICIHRPPEFPGMRVETF